MKTQFHRSDRPGPTDHEAGAQPASERVRIPVGEVTLSGDLEIPANAAGIVLFAHGSGSSRHSPRNQFVARALRETGAATLLFDLLTREEEAADAATGHLRFNIELLAERLVAATRWVTHHLQGRGFRVGYFGASTGGAAALVAAASLGPLIEAIVARGSRPDLARDALEYVEAPTLLIVGERDETVLELNRSAYARLQCKKELAVVPRATHLFEEPGTLEEVARLASEWFGRYLRPR